MKNYQILIAFVATLLVSFATVRGTGQEQEHEFVNLVKNLLQGDELKTFQSK